MQAQNYTPIDDLIKKYKEPANPISAPNREAGPVSLKPPEPITMQEAVEHDKLDEAVKPYVDVKEDTMKLSHDLKMLGLHAIESSKFKDYQNVKLPLSDDKIVLGMHAPLSSSLRWLSMLALYLLRQAHLTIKVVHGKAVRVVKR